MQCVTLWIGPRLGAVERACLRSVVRQGHSLALYCYRTPDGVPEGVEVRDAAAVLPEHLVVHHQTGSVALFSNWFRYELQRLGAGTWLDADAYLVAPLDAERPYLVGYQEPGRLNVGILRLPPDAPILDPLLAVFEEREVPHWLRGRDRVAAHWRRRRTGRTGVARMSWGATGPAAMTALAPTHGVAASALDREVLYPVPFTDAGWIRDPSRRLDDVITARTVSVHLWNELIKPFKEQPAPAGSFLARLQQEGA